MESNFNDNINSLKVIKRNGDIQEMNFNKILNRIKFLTEYPTLLNNIDVLELCKKTIDQIRNNITTTEIDEETAIVAERMSTKEREYSVLAARIRISNHQKNTAGNFKYTMEMGYLNTDDEGDSNPLVGYKYFKFVEKNANKIQKYIKYERDFLVSYFGFETLIKSYLIKINGKIIERPQDMFMRVAVFIHMDTKKFKSTDPEIIKNIFDTYDQLSLQYFTVATPALINSGTVRPQLASCFLLRSEDSIEAIHKTHFDADLISKWCGGLGIDVKMWRSNGSLIRGTGGKSNGVIPFLRMYQSGLKAFNQGGKRKGSGAIYMSPDHYDFHDLLLSKRQHGDEETLLRDLFIAAWIPDLFMERVKADEQWSMFCPDKCPLLFETYGDKYKELYIKYEKEGKAKKVMSARKLYKEIYLTQCESGMPYILYKDTINRCNMQKNIGMISSSNLCAEIVEYSSTDEYAVCTLASISLPKYVLDSYTFEELGVSKDKISEKANYNLSDYNIISNREVSFIEDYATNTLKIDSEIKLRKLNHEFPQNPIFDYKLFAKHMGKLVIMLNKIIDKNYYPLIETVRSNIKHRPMGIGVQGLADVFCKFKISFESDEAKELNKKIFETMYYASLSQSAKLSRDIYMDATRSIKNKGKYINHLYSNDLCNQYPNLKKEQVENTYTDIKDLPTDIGSYHTYRLNEGSPLANGKFHWELYDLTTEDMSGMWEWDTLKALIKKFGVRNSLNIALMPTASTSQIMGNNECFEPYKYNLYERETQAGSFIITNKFLVNDLQKINAWTPELINYMKMNNGSIQGIENIPQKFKDVYKTAYEIKQKHIIDLAADRQPFIDQSQSLNLYLREFTYAKFSSMHFYTWERGLKTACYYQHTEAATSAQQFSVDPEAQRRLNEMNKTHQKNKQNTVPKMLDNECLACGS